MNRADVVKMPLLYDPETGLFKWTDSPKCKRSRKEFAGHKQEDGYVVIRFGGLLHRAHRLAWVICNGDLTNGIEIDHINGDRSDNRVANLRAVSKHTNAENQRKAGVSNTSGFLGVDRRGDSWRASIRVSGEKIHLGIYATPELAHQAYVEAKRLHHKGCTL